jgi:NADPH2:quinone reductase
VEFSFWHQNIEQFLSLQKLFEVVAWGKVRINANQRFALKDAADAHKALETRVTSSSTILSI